MSRTILPKALALTLFAAGLATMGAQQPQTAPDAAAPQANAPMYRHRHADPQRQAKFLTHKLKLTADQSARIEPILADRDQKVQALRHNQQLAPEDRHQQMRAINEQARQQMAGVLSPDQMQQLQSMRHERHGRHGQDSGQDAENGQSPS